MFAIALTADMTGITDLRPKDTEETPFYYTFKVQCTSCRETHVNEVGVSRFDKNALSGSKGDANFVWKCKNCRREASASIKDAPIPYTSSSPPKQQNILLIECRGCEFLDFKPEGEWLCKAEENSHVFNVSGSDLEEGEWFDYDEKEGAEVSIREVKFVVKRA